MLGSLEAVAVPVAFAVEGLGFFGENGLADLGEAFFVVPVFEEGLPAVGVDGAIEVAPDFVEGVFGAEGLLCNAGFDEGEAAFDEAPAAEGNFFDSFVVVHDDIAFFHGVLQDALSDADGAAFCIEEGLEAEG